MDSSVQLTPPRVEFYVLGSAAAQDRLRAACQLAGKGWLPGLLRGLTGYTSNITANWRARAGAPACQCSFAARMTRN